MLVTVLLVYMDWRSLFVLFGSIGFVWALAWYRWFRDSPEEHSGVGATEREAIESGLAADAGHAREATQWKRLLANRTVVCLCLMYFTQAFGGTFYVTWLPTYLASRGLSGMTAGILAGLPLILSAAADLLGGIATDRAARRLGLRLGRISIGGGANRRGSVHDCRLVRGVAGGGGRADCAWRRLVELSARSCVGNMPRHRRPPFRRGERGDEYIRAGGIDPQSDSRRHHRAAVLELESAALPGWRAISARCAVLEIAIER
jgi:hypothetical protein